MNALSTFNTENQTVSARELHEKLNINSNFSTWFGRMVEYGFSKGTDFFPKMEESTGGRPATDYEVSVDMAKQICMIQRTPEGKRIRQYLIDLEKAWNTPEQVMARALRIADRTISGLTAQVEELQTENQKMLPKADFYDAVTSSSDTMSVSEVAKILNLGFGQNKLFRFMRDRRILMSNNLPYQEYIRRGYFRVIEQKYDRPDGEVGISCKTLVTQKGMEFIKKKYEEAYA